MDRPTGRYRRGFGVAAAMLLLLNAAAHAQTASAPALKAAFLYNFAKFVEWPADSMPAAAALVICVLGDDAVADALEETVKDHTVDGHPLTARRLKSGAPLRACHLLYISGVDAKRSQELLADLRASTVLTVSDLVGFAQAGGVANFFVENGRMRFAVNIESAHRARLQVSSRLLGVATIVKDLQHVQP
jgi:YfiR/HmsC-like